MQIQASRGTELVYGNYRGDELVFIPKQQAVELAQLRQALESAATWGEFKQMAPAHLYQEVALMVSDYDEEAGQLPQDADPFDADSIPGYGDRDWPTWAAQAMLEWVPQDVQDRFGSAAGTTLSGDYLYLPEEKADEIAQAMQEHGYPCVRDDDLVTSAEGYS